MAPLKLALTNAGINQGHSPIRNRVARRRRRGRARLAEIGPTHPLVPAQAGTQRVDPADDPSSFRGRANGPARSGRPDDRLREEPGIHYHDPCGIPGSRPAAATTLQHVG